MITCGWIRLCCCSLVYHWVCSLSSSCLFLTVRVWGWKKCWVKLCLQRESSTWTPPPPPPQQQSWQANQVSGVLRPEVSPRRPGAARRWGGSAPLWPGRAAASWGIRRPPRRPRRLQSRTDVKSATRSDRKPRWSSTACTKLTHPEVDVSLSSAHHQHRLVSFLSGGICQLVTCCFSPAGHRWNRVTWKNKW